MKSLFLTAIVLSASAAFANQNCNIFVPHDEAPVGLRMKSVLASKGFKIVPEESKASYVISNLIQCQEGLAFATYCEYSFSISSLNGSLIYSNSVPAFDLERLWAKGKQRKALRKLPLNCVNGEMVGL